MFSTKTKGKQNRKGGFDCGVRVHLERPNPSRPCQGPNTHEAGVMCVGRGNSGAPSGIYVMVDD